MNVPNTAEEMRSLIGQFLARGDGESQKLWDIITAQRGPDAPSERSGMNSSEYNEAYRARRARKRETVEVIRFHSFGGKVGGDARFRSDRDYVILPAEDDHFNRHVRRAALALGLKIRKEPSNDEV